MSGAVLAVVVLAAVAGAWWWMKTHPYGRCRWCRGSGKNPLSTEWRSGPCKRCGGTGRREWKV